MEVELKLEPGRQEPKVIILSLIHISFLIS